MRTRALTTLVIASVLSLGAAVPALAAASAATPVGVTITGGVLSITAPVGAVDLGTRENVVA
jgi:hypothetical protein